MAQNQVQVLVHGSGPVALLTALELHAAHIPVSLIGADMDSPPPPQNPELVCMWGDESLPGLFHQSLSLWRSAPQRLGLPGLFGQIPLADLATSAGRETKLREEALLDALGGEAITYVSPPPQPFAPAAVLGVKSWPAAPVFAPGLLLTLRDAVAARGIPVHASPVQTVAVEEAAAVATLADGTTHRAAFLVLASAPAARPLLAQAGLNLPLRPARGHVFTLPAPAGTPLPLTVLRLKRGHLFVVPMPNQTLEVYYDALLDPRQATARPEADTALLAALGQHLGTLIPALAPATPAHGATLTHWLTPDFLPALGPWGAGSPLLLAIGWCAREAAFAAAAAHHISRHVQNEEPLTGGDFAPNRFASGNWKKVERPGTLNWHEPSTQVAVQLTTAPEYMGTVATVSKTTTYAGNIAQTESKTTTYADTVGQKEKTILAADKKLPEIRERDSKRKVQTAGISNKS